MFRGTEMSPNGTYVRTATSVAAGVPLFFFLHTPYLQHWSTDLHLLPMLPITTSHHTLPLSLSLSHSLSQNMLEQRILAKGMELEPLKYYVESFKHGVSPHAGAGIGLERVVFLYLGECEWECESGHIRPIVNHYCGYWISPYSPRYDCPSLITSLISLPISLGLDNVRKASMFPRDPNRCQP